VKQESIPNKIDEILENEMIDGYTAKEKPLMKKKYNQRKAIAENQFQNGETIGQ